MKASAYLERVGWQGALAADAATLRRLHRRHLEAVPFENLDIHLERPLSLALPDLYAKIVTRRRGGFCYELNGLYAWLLGELGFAVTLHSARVVGADGVLGPEFDHLTLGVEVPGGGGSWLADVGFGDSFLEPLSLATETPQEAGGVRHRVVPRDGARRAVDKLEASGEWRPQYVFTDRARALDEFVPQCRWFETSADSHFRRRRLVTRATRRGRVTVAGLTLIETEAGRRTETELAGEQEWRRTLVERFGPGYRF